MGQKIPKQFINVGEKPVIVYTLEAFQNHPLVDANRGCVLGWMGAGSFLHMRDNTRLIS